MHLADAFIQSDLQKKLIQAILLYCQYVCVQTMCTHISLVFSDEYLQITDQITDHLYWVLFVFKLAYSDCWHWKLCMRFFESIG